ALREAKRNTSWLEPNERWEGDVKRFCRSLYENPGFLADFEPFAAEVADTGRRAALGQLALRLTSPGVPAIYQGDQLQLPAPGHPSDSRPVVWARRRRRLSDRSSPKLNLIRALLARRSRRPAAFAGGYEPLDAGKATCAFRRGEDVVVAVPVREWDIHVELPP